jgi:hypothetical protein
MALTEFQIKNAKAADKQQKLSDSGGLFMLVHPNGSKYWRMAYRFDGKQKLLAIGKYPSTTLAQARSKRDVAKALLDLRRYRLQSVPLFWPGSHQNPQDG